MSENENLPPLSSILVRIPALATDTCGKCCFSRQEQNDLTCHFQPPSISFLALPAPPPRVGQMMVQAFSGFPIVQPQQWCGKFVPIRGR